MIIGAKVEIRGHLAMPKARLVEYEKRAFTLALQKWHREMLPKHFAPNAKQVYRYERRTAAYEQRKERVKGHRLSLVWSGSSREMAERRIDIRPTKKHTTGKIHVARAFNFSGRGAMPDMKAEVSRILKREQKELLGLVGEEMRRQIGQDASVKVVSI